MKEVAVKVAELHEDKDIEIWGLDFSPDGKYLAATSPTTLEVQIWDWQNKRITQTLEKKGSDLMTTEPIRYSPDGRLLVWCGGVVVKIWNTNTWELVHTIDGTSGITAAGGGCNAIDFTPDGKSLIGVFQRTPVKSGDTLTIYDTSTWQPVWGLRTVPFHPETLSISPDGKFAAIAGLLYDSTGKETEQIAIVDLGQRKIIPFIKEFADLGHLAWSADGAYLTAAGGGGVRVFDVHSGTQVADEPLKSAHMVVRYTRDGEYLLESDMDALGNGLGVRIWDGQHRELLQVIPGNVGSLAVSGDGHYFATGEDKKTIIWQLK